MNASVVGGVRVTHATTQALRTASPSYVVIASEGHGKTYQEVPCDVHRRWLNRRAHSNSLNVRCTLRAEYVQVGSIFYNQAVSGLPTIDCCCSACGSGPIRQQQAPVQEKFGVRKQQKSSGRSNEPLEMSFLERVFLRIYIFCITPGLVVQG